MCDSDSEPKEKNLAVVASLGILEGGFGDYFAFSKLFELFAGSHR